MNEDEF